MRLNFDAETHEGAKQYLITRSRQLQTLGYEIEGIERIAGIASIARFSKKSEDLFEVKKYNAIYILKNSRGQNKYEEIYKQYCRNGSIVTTPSCNIASFLASKGIPHKVEIPLFETCVGYQMIQEYYGDRRAKRSGLFLMNHIDEGFTVLSKLQQSRPNLFKTLDKKSIDSMYTAFAIHPMLQSDESLKEFVTKNHDINSLSLILAMEYRRVANAYLSTRSIKGLEEIELSPVPEVNIMLLADKIQNYKDFRRYHAKTHPRAYELDQYFNNWLKKLDYTEVEFFDMERDLCRVNEIEEKIR